MFKKIAVLILLWPLVSFADDISMSAANANAENCQNLACVRANIDDIDTQLVQLIGERLAYVKRAGELKTGKASSVEDENREQELLYNVGQEAAQVGYPPIIAQAIFKEILNQAKIYEKLYFQR